MKHGLPGLPTQDGLWSRWNARKEISPWPFLWIEYKWCYVLKKHRGEELEAWEWLRVFHKYGMFYPLDYMRVVLRMMGPWGVKRYYRYSSGMFAKNRRLIYKYE